MGSKKQSNKKVLRGPLIIINLSLPRRRESSDVKSFWIPAFAGMTFLEVALSMSRDKIENCEDLNGWQKAKELPKSIHRGTEQGKFQKDFEHRIQIKKHLP
jgi:hypothetical protein